MSYEELKKNQLAEFEGDEPLAAEYSVHRTCKMSVHRTCKMSVHRTCKMSVHRTCKMSDGGFHCSCYDDAPKVEENGYKHGGECCICEELNPDFAAKKP